MADSFISALLASLFLEAGVVGFLAERWLTGYGLMSLGAAILIVRLEAAGVLSRERMQGLLVGLVIATLSIGLFTVYLRSLGGGFAGEDAPQNTAGLGSGKYRAVILWTKPKSPAVLVVPRPPAGRGLNQSLGRLPVTSIPQRITESELRPTREVLGFPIPANPRIWQFDSATVKFIRNGKRGIRSAQIAVERFTLVPRGL